MIRPARISHAALLRDNVGAALLLVLVVLVVLTAVIVQFMFSTNVDSRIADNYIARLKNDAAIDGGVAKAISLLREDGYTGKDDVDSLQDVWAGGAAGLAFGNTKVHVWIMDEQGKLNLNLLKTKDTRQISRVHAELKRLVKSVGLDESEADDVADAVRDRIDEDKQGRFEEEGSNEKFMGVSQLVELESVTDLLYYGSMPDEDDLEEAVPGLCRFVTIWGSGRVNINTASAEVLAALSDKIDIDTAAEIVEYRDDTIFLEIKELLDVPSVTPDMFSDISNKVCVFSNYFSVICFAETEGVESVGVSIIYRDTSGCRVVQSFAGNSKLRQAYWEEVGELEEREEEEKEKEEF